MCQGIKPLRGRGAPITGLMLVLGVQVFDINDLLLKLGDEAIRLIFRQEQNHELIDSNHQSVASTLARRHADAQTLPHPNPPPEGEGIRAVSG